MKPRIFIATSLLVLLSLVGVTVSTVFAQEPTEQPITTKTDLKSEIADVERSYRGQLEEYRQAERQFTVAKNEYQQLNTLSTLETAVQATKKTFLTRDQVLLSYLKLIELNLIETNGIDINVKNALLADVRTFQNQMQNHYDQTQLSNDRAQMATLADDFEDLAKEFDLLTDYSINVIRLGQLQANRDRTNAFFAIVEQEATPSGSITGSERDRALDQIKSEFSNLDTMLSQTEVSNEKSRRNGGQNTRSLTEIYVQLVKIQQYIDEVIR